MMRFTVLFKNFGFYGLSVDSGFGFEKYVSVFKTEGSCKVTGLMFS